MNLIANGRSPVQKVSPEEITFATGLLNVPNERLLTIEAAVAEALRLDAIEIAEGAEVFLDFWDTQPMLPANLPAADLSQDPPLRPATALRSCGLNVVYTAVRCRLPMTTSA